jgi:hypothetical protein
MKFRSILIEPEFNTAEIRGWNLCFMRYLILHIWRTRSENPTFLFEIGNV